MCGACSLCKPDARRARGGGEEEEEEEGVGRGGGQVRVEGRIRVDSGGVGDGRSGQ